jgi:hypothetical protein
MKYRIELTAVDPSGVMADHLDALDAKHNGVIEFEDEEEEDFARFLEDFAGDVGEGFARMTITKVDS